MTTEQQPVLDQEVAPSDKMTPPYPIDIVFSSYQDADDARRTSAEIDDQSLVFIEGYMPDGDTDFVDKLLLLNDIELEHGVESNEYIAAKRELQTHVTSDDFREAGFSQYQLTLLELLLEDSRNITLLPADYPRMYSYAKTHPNHYRRQDASQLLTPAVLDNQSAEQSYQDLTRFLDNQQSYYSLRENHMTTEVYNHLARQAAHDINRPVVVVADNSQAESLVETIEATGQYADLLAITSTIRLNIPDALDLPIDKTEHVTTLPLRAARLVLENIGVTMGNSDTKEMEALYEDSAELYREFALRALISRRRLQDGSIAPGELI